MAKNPWLVRAGIGIGVLAIVARWWARNRTGDNPTSWSLVALGAAIVAVIAIGIVVLLGRSSTRQARGVQAARPDAEVAAGWADAALASQLADLGVDASFRQGGGTHMVLSWDQRGIELWRGVRAPRVVTALPWDQVLRVTVGDGVAGATPRPAVVIETRQGPRLVVVPARGARGGLLPARADEVAALAADLTARVSALRA